jgi:DNA-directed RNA polymerase subunit RPC12/RpoP
MYCLKCKKHFEPKKSEEVTMRNGRRAQKAVCEDCGTTAFKILGKLKPPAEPLPTPNV